MIKCAQCGANNEDESNFCGSCGERMKVIYKFCPKCGKENMENVKICTKCGIDLETSKPTIKDLKKLNSLKGDELPGKIVELDLTPAESLIILDHKSHRTPKELLKVTFIDLIFKNVFKLDVQEVEKKGILGTRKNKKIYLQEGKNFNKPLKPHEEIFREYLPSKADSRRFKKLQKRVARHSNDYVNKKLLEPLASKDYFNVEKKFLGKKYSLSDKGIETKNMILKLQDEGIDLEKWIETDPDKARAYLLMGGSNIFLTDDYYFEWFKNNSKKISKLFTGVAIAGLVYNFSNIHWYAPFIRHSSGIDFDDFDDFDTGFDSFDSSFNDIFSDFDTFDTFDSMDFSDFDSGFDSGGSDSGGFDGGGGDF